MLVAHGMAIKGWKQKSVASDTVQIPSFDPWDSYCL